jgi:hypothetical protein
MKAYQNKESGLWKWGTKGEFIHTTRDAAYKFGMEQLAQALRRMREKQAQIGQNHGKRI